MKWNIRIGRPVALAIVLSGAASLAQNPPDRPHTGARQEWMRERAGGRPEENAEGLLYRLLWNPKLKEELGLTEQQVSALHDAAASMKNPSAQLSKELESSAVEQARLMMADTVDEQALMTAVEKTGKIRTEIAKLNVKALVALKQVLTPEQTAKARDLMRRRMALHREGAEWHKRAEGFKAGEGAQGQPREKGIKPREDAAAERL